MPVLMTHIYSQCTYRMCGFHVASGDKIQGNLRWLAGDSCLSLLCVLLSSIYRCRAQVRLLTMALLTGKWRLCKWKAIYIYIYHFQQNVCRKVRVCLRHELWFEARKERGTIDIMVHQLLMDKLMDIDWY